MPRLIWAVLLAIGVISCSRAETAAAQTISPQAFRDAVADEVLRQRPGLCIEKPDAFTLHVGRTMEACEEAVVSTSYVYRQYSNEPDRLPTYVSGLAAAALSAVQSLDDTPLAPDHTSLSALVRPSAYSASLRTSAEGSGGIWKPFVGDLIAVLVQQDGAQSRSLTSADLRALHLTEAAAWDLAISNLRTQIGELERSRNPHGAEIVTSATGLAPSLLLLPETCQAGGSNFDAFVVARDTYFYADQRSASATSSLAGYVAQLLRSEETYSDQLISCTDGHWQASVFNGVNAWVPAESAHSAPAERR